MNEKTKRMTREQFAQEYGICTRTVDRLRLAGKLVWFRLGRKIFIVPPDEQLLAQQRAAI